MKHTCMMSFVVERLFSAQTDSQPQLFHRFILPILSS